MSIYGALYAGVAGLGAQSNKIGVISDNIANVNTVGYKGGTAQFQTLVTSSGGSAAYSPGGVIGGNHQLIGTQGLLQPTTSPTDIAISGNGLFVVNQKPDDSGQVLFTRSGSFTQDATGNFKNTAGFYLQAWPLDRNGNLPGAPGNLNTASSANLSSLQTVNVQNLTGTAAATSNISIGANLKSSDTNYAGADGVVKMDAQDSQNHGISSKAIIVPGGVDHLTRGDKFVVSTGTGLSTTFTYGGFTLSRSVTSGANGDSGKTVQAIQTTIGVTSDALTPVTSIDAAITLGSSPYATTNGSATVTVTAVGHGLTTGDTVTLAGNTAIIGGIPSADFNGAFTVTVLDADHYQITAAAPASSDATGGSGAITSTVVPFATTSGSSTVVVTSPTHKLVTGETVSIAGVTAAVGGISAANLNRASAVITVIDANHYSYVAGAAAGSTATGGAGTITETPLPFTTGAALSGDVTITSPAHGLNVGDYVTLSGMTAATNVDGITTAQLTGTFKITAVSDANHYTITTAGSASSGNTAGGAGTIAALVAPFSVTASSNQVTVYQPTHNLKTGDTVTFSGNTGNVGSIPGASLNGSFIVTVIDANHYTIKATSSSTSAGSGGSGTIVANMRPFAGDILDATSATQPLLGVTGTSGFTDAALKFSINTAASGTVNFTYVSSSPNTQKGEFNNLNNLADAINSVNGLSARVVSGRLYIGATDANASVTFSNGSTVGVSGPPLQSGIDWIGELGLSDVSAASSRFSNMEGLAALVNNTTGLKATIQTPTGAATLNISVDDPLDTIDFSDKPVAAPLPAFTSATPFTVTAGSNVVTVTQPAPHGYSTGDIVHIDASALPGSGPYNGIPKTDLTGDFVVTVTSPTTYTITVADPATVSGPTGGTGLIITPPNNKGSVLAALGLVPSLNGGSFTPKTTGAIGPSYDASNSAKNMASGAIAPQFNKPITIYDAQGTAHTVNVGFIKTAANTWAVEVFAQPATDISSALPNGQIAVGKITFNGDGSLGSVSPSLLQAANINWTNGASSSAVTLNWGTAGQPFGTANATAIGKTDGLSQFNSDYHVNFVNQNGAPVGQLIGVSIDGNGYIIANYNNGENQKLYKIPLAKFQNPDQLQSSSGNAYAQTTSSGEVNLVQAGSSGVGTIASSSLESSNVELADQLTDMIVAQRAYQANTKVISTASTLLDDLNQILR